MTRRFDGFVATTDPAVPVPRAFFTDVLPGLTDLNEIQVTLSVFHLAQENGGIQLPVSEAAIRRDRSLRAALRVAGSPREPDRRIDLGLDLATARGTILRFAAEFGDSSSTWYYVNTPANQALVAAMSRGAVAPPEVVWRDGDVPAVQPERPSVFRLYEQNIGLLSPLIADRFVDALETYPVEWIEAAIDEAVSYNRRSWRYIQRILEKWASEGREPASSGSSTRGRP